HSALHSFPTRRSSDLKDVQTVPLRLLTECTLRIRDAAQDGELVPAEPRGAQGIQRRRYAVRLAEYAQQSIACSLGQPITSSFAKDRKSTRLNSSHVKI